MKIAQCESYGILSFIYFLLQVQRILLELDIQNIQDNPAQHLSEGQKRKLTFGIAILGDPKVSAAVHGEECRWNVNEKPSSSFTSESSSAFLVMYQERICCV